MAQTAKAQRTIHPLAAFNFRVTIDGSAVRFTRVTGIQREHQTVTYRHGLSFAEGEDIEKFHVNRFATITMEQGTVDGSHFLHEWLETKRPSVMEISLCDETGAPAISWHVARAVPVKMSAPAFDAKTNELSIEVLEVRAAGISIRQVS